MIVRRKALKVLMLFFGKRKKIICSKYLFKIFMYLEILYISKYLETIITFKRKKVDVIILTCSIFLKYLTREIRSAVTSMAFLFNLVKKVA